jgi:PAS domain S-box-containing protein
MGGWSRATASGEDGRAGAMVSGRDAARAATEAVVSRIGAIVSGLAAVAWEADARSWEFTFVSDRAEEMLGYPASDWLGDAGFWPRIIHPDDREEAVRLCAEGTASGGDYDFTYRAIAADGRVVWLHDIVHVVSDPDGARRELQGVLIDVTGQKRREQGAALLAEAGRLLAGGESMSSG